MSRLVGKPTMLSPNRSDTNQAVQAQKMARGWKFCMLKVEELYYPVAKTKALISFAVTAKLICAFVFAYADCWFSHGAAQMFHCVQQKRCAVGENRSSGFPTRYDTKFNQPTHLRKKARILTFWV